eukprot:scaffold155881_cov27-Tisochrysis_lutea.AAC.3
MSAWAAATSVASVASASAIVARLDEGSCSTACTSGGSKHNKRARWTCAIGPWSNAACAEGNMAAAPAGVPAAASVKQIASSRRPSVITWPAVHPGEAADGSGPPARESNISCDWRAARAAERGAVATSAARQRRAASASGVPPLEHALRASATASATSLSNLQREKGVSDMREAIRAMTRNMTVEWLPRQRA